MGAGSSKRLRAECSLPGRPLVHGSSSSSMSDHKCAGPGTGSRWLYRARVPEGLRGCSVEPLGFGARARSTWRPLLPNLRVGQAGPRARGSEVGPTNWYGLERSAKGAFMTDQIPRLYLPMRAASDVAPGVPSSLLRRL